MPAPPKRPSPHLLAISTLVVVLAGCGGGDGRSGDGAGAATTCAESARKQFVLDITRDWYLFDDTLPATVSPADFTDAEALLDHLTATARAQGKDRYFSYLTTRSEESSLLGEGQFVGFGFRTRIDLVNRPMLLEVFEASPAADAALQRGDEIVAVDSGDGYVPVAELLADGTTISDVLGPADPGLQRGLRLLRDGVTHEVTLTKRTVTIDPVPDTYGVQVFPQPGTAGVGYLNLRSYISTADPQLTTAFDQFQRLGLQDFIIDLRYNGGGLLSTSQLVNDLLGGARSTSDVQSRLEYSARRSGSNTTRTFRPRAESTRPVRIAFLTTGATASASEMNVNSMAPWVEVAIVGEDTLGKPVGQDPFDLSGCDDRLRLVTFRMVNARGDGDYYDGLAGTVPFACAAQDLLDRPLGATDDEMVVAALEWLATGACATVMPTAAARAKAGLSDDAARHPLPRRPTAAQWWLPGVD